MIYGVNNNATATSLLSEYSLALGDAVLRHRARVAEHSARIEAELASKVKSEFIATMSHELRTPLNTIIGFSKLMSQCDRRELAPDEISEYGHLIHDAAEHLLAIINDILDISKIQSGKYSLHPREVALDEILQVVVASFSLTAREAGVALEQHIDMNLPTVRGDALKLRQVFTNLISNAVKFTPTGGTVAVEAITTPSGGSMVFVRDSGIGMSEDEVRIALTPFGQVDGSHSRWREGTGLGLPIAKALVVLHGGRLQIHSEKNKGTEVVVTLPPPHQVSVAQGRDMLLGQDKIS